MSALSWVTCVALAFSGTASAAEGEPATSEAPAAPAAPAPATPAALEPPLEAKDDWSKSFGDALSASNVSVTWSGYGNFTMYALPDQPITFEPSSFNPILVARMSDKLSAEIEFEVKLSGVATEYAFLDYVPVDWFTVRVGRFLIPIGKFNETLHPSFRWNMVTRPLMFKEAVPVGWYDTGLQLRGRHTLARALKLEWQAYVINGFRATTASMDENGNPLYDAERVFREARGETLADNNDDKAAGGHVSFLIFPGREYGAAEIGVSGVTGALDPEAAWRASFIDVDASVALGPLTLRGEAVRNYLNPEKRSMRAFEEGAYLQATYQAGDVNVAARWDWVVERPYGGDKIARRQVAVSAGHAVGRYLSLRGEVGFPIGAPSPMPSFALQTAFHF